MSTRTLFDLEGLAHAIELSDVDYHAALYAEAAELKTVDADQPTARPAVYRGKRAIKIWLDQVSATWVDHKVVSLAATGDEVTLTEECRSREGVRVTYTYAAAVSRGQMKSCTVTRRLLNPVIRPTTSAEQPVGSMPVTDTTPRVHRPTMSDS
ncbi:MAG TPA: hypothetical protein VFP89_12070 [Propionibacteriaceae bacterium]|nr:hypothetical protein [Propionibacteriaceae bacterium]